MLVVHVTITMALVVMVIGLCWNMSVCVRVPGLAMCGLRRVIRL